MKSHATCYEDAIPGFVEQALDRLHGSVQASLRHLDAHGETHKASAYVRHAGNEVDAALLYRVEGGRVNVLTHVVEMPAEQVNAFADFIFGRYPGVNRIEFPALAAQMDRITLPHYARIYRSDVVIDPAPTPEQYEQQLSKRVRQNLRYRRNRLMRDCPDFTLRSYDETDFSEAEVREILRLSRERIEDKTETWQYSEPETERMIALLRRGGLVCVAYVGGKLCGGNLCYRLGESYSFVVLGFENRYAEYSMGMHLAYLGIVEALRRKAQRINLGFMVYDYKLWLGGRVRRLDKLVIYRSRLQQALDAPANLLDYCASNKREVLAQARKASHRKDALGLTLRTLRSAVRMAKRPGVLMQR